MYMAALSRMCVQYQFSSSAWLGHMLGHRECQCDDFYRQIVLDYEKSDFYHFKQKNYVVNFYRFKFNLPNFYRTPTLWRSNH